MYPVAKPAMGMGFQWVKYSVPVPVTKPRQNPWVFPYSCYSLAAGEVNLQAEGMKGLW